MRSISLEEYIAETQDFCSMSRKENTIPVIEKPALPGRKPVSHKNSYGRALIIGGSIGFSGAPVNYGKATMGVVRTTYLIDENGVIVKAMDKVKAAENPA